MSQTLERNGQPVSLADIYRPIQKPLEQVEALLRRELHSDLAALEPLLEHSQLVGGKRMRPVFLLLAGACCGELHEGHRRLAAALEMIHTASLVHDDVLDHAQTRRHRETANVVWGNRASVLLGDYLFTHAFSVAAASGCLPAVAALADAAKRVCVGEIRQNSWVGNFELSEPDYLEMISEKTGELVGCGCRLGAILSGASVEQVAAFDQFGQDLGIAFQIIDDVLDLVGDQQQVGKTLGTDLENRKPTLPVIHALREADAVRRKEMQEALMAPAGRTAEVLDWLEQSESLRYARDVAAAHAERAIAFVRSLPASPYARGLENAARFVLQRSH